MSWFDNLIQRFSRVTPLMNIGLAGEPQWQPRRFDKFAEEGYKKNVVVFRCIDSRAAAVASAPYSLFEHSGEDKIQIFDHPVLDLLRKPNPRQNKTEFFYSLIGYYSIGGNTFIEAVPGADGITPHELWIKRPDRMKVIPGKFGIQGYEWTGNGQRFTWSADQITGESPIMHMKTFHPLNDFYGMSPMEAAARNIDQNNSADEWNYHLLLNSASPSGVLETEQDLGGDVVKRLMRAFKLKHVGVHRAGSTPVLTHGLKWKGMAFSPKDMLIIQAKSMTARFICQAFGVPPFLLGLPEGATFSNYGEARMAFWDETIIPLILNTTEHLNKWLIPKFRDKRNLLLEPNFDGMPALEPRRTSKWERTVTAWESGLLTRDEGRKEIGFPSAATGGDEFNDPKGSTDENLDV